MTDHAPSSFDSIAEPSPFAAGPYTEHLARVREHFRSLKPRRALLAELVVHRLASRSLAARKFTAGREAKLASDLVRTLRAVVYASASYAEWSEGLLRLARVHAASGATLEHYREFRTVFLQALSELEESAWSQSGLGESWSVFFDAAMGHLSRVLFQEQSRAAA